MVQELQDWDFGMHLPWLNCREEWLQIMEPLDLGEEDGGERYCTSTTVVTPSPCTRRLIASPLHGLGPGASLLTVG
jgi:hypothetical protein